jgi:Ca2+-binding EF-hand superfamily protein
MVAAVAPAAPPTVVAGLRLELLEGDDEPVAWEAAAAVHVAQPADCEQHGSGAAAHVRAPSGAAASARRGYSPRVALPASLPRGRPPREMMFPPAASRNGAESARRIWVGGIPEELIDGAPAESAGEPQGPVPMPPNSKLAQCFKRFGTLVAVTLRRKPGPCKSWALITFESVEEADAALAADTQYGAPPVKLKVHREDAETQLQKPTTRALAGVYQTQQDAEEAWMQGLLDSMSPRGASGKEAVVHTPRAPASPKAAFAPTLRPIADKSARVSVETQITIARDQLKQAAQSTDLHRIAAALSAARSLAQKFEQCKPLRKEADQFESRLRQSNPKMGKKLDLHRSDQVRRHVRRLWDLLLLECAAPDDNGKLAVNLDGYCKLHICIGKAVSDDSDWNVAEARTYAHTDWNDDVDRFSNDAGINAWLAKVKTTLQNKVSSSIATFGWQAIFAEIDADGNGQLDCAEFTAGLRKAGLDTQLCSDSEIQLMFTTVDADGGGEIDGVEFANWLNSTSALDSIDGGRKQQKHTADRRTETAMRAARALQEQTAQRVADLGWKRLFESVDTDGNGELDVDEFRAALRTHGLSEQEVSDTELAEVFNLIDSDGGGSLSSSEFVAALRKPETSGYTMTYQAFESSMFELADYWSAGVKEESYIHFFDTLFRAITELIPGAGDYPFAVLSNGNANYKLKDTKYIGSLVNADGMFDAQLLAAGMKDAPPQPPQPSPPPASSSQRHLRAARSEDRRDLAASFAKKNKPRPSGRDTTRFAASPEMTSHQPAVRSDSDADKNAAQLADQGGDASKVAPWRAGMYHGTWQVSQSLGPAVKEPESKAVHYRPQSATAPQDVWRFRPTQRYVAVPARATHSARQPHGNVYVSTARPHTTSAARGGARNPNGGHRRNKAAEGQMKLRPWPPPREVVFVEGPMVDRRAMQRAGGGGSAGRVSPWKGFWLAPIKRLQ